MYSMYTRAHAVERRSAVCREQSAGVVGSGARRMGESQVIFVGYVHEAEGTRDAARAACARHTVCISPRVRTVERNVLRKGDCPTLRHKIMGECQMGVTDGELGQILEGGGGVCVC